MSITKGKIPSAIKSSLKYVPTLKLTINQSTLDTHLRHCRNGRQFNQILSQVIFTGFIKDTFAASRVLKFSTDSTFIYIDYSRKIFDLMIENSNGFIWNTMMKAYLQTNAQYKVVLLYKLMLQSNVEPDNYTYPILVQAATLRFSVLEGTGIHNHVLKTGFTADIYVKNTLINMYVNCGNIKDAKKLFDGSPVLDSVSWNSMLAGYVQVGDVVEAKLIFDQMPEKNTIASNSMIVLLGRFGNVIEARCLFDEMPKRDMVSWSALISCYEQNEMYEDALFTFTQMNTSAYKVDEVLIVSVLSACANLSAIIMGELVHGIVIKIGIEPYINLQNALIHMYACSGQISSAEELFDGGYNLDQIAWNSMISGYMRDGSIDKAKSLFDSMPEKDVVSWGAMLSGYAHHNQYLETLDLFHKMQLENMWPDDTTLVSVISACAHVAALDQGKWIHAYVKKNKLKVNFILGTTLIDMYMKCGCVENALEVFYGMEEKRVSTWNAVILGLALNGLVDKSLDYFSNMEKIGVMPNEITYMGLLGACRHMGLVEKGRYYFSDMIQKHKIEPNVKHYGCMVDLLGRAGLLEEAEKLIESMPMAPDIATWGALLGACRKHRKNEMGEKIGKKLIELQPHHDGFHVLLSNIYASKGNWESVLDIRDMMIQRGVIKTPGCSSIEANGVVHEFLAGDKSHSRYKEIEKMLDEMGKRLKMEGYVPDKSEVSLDIDEEEKETTLFQHSEKLAIAFGLIAISPPLPVRIMKNLRICNDCHSAAKIVSKAFDRDIIVRDRHRFHHFKKGSCSCMDYW